MKLQLYHGTSKANAELIAESEFITNKKYNWKVKSKPGYVYLSSAYAPFYCMKSAKNYEYALIKVEVDTEDLYPEDDFLMYALKKPVYTQKELDEVDFEKYKYLWEKSLLYIGNVAVKPDKLKIIGIKYFNGKDLIIKCDPIISPINFKVLGEYYKRLTEWIFEGKNILEFTSIFEEFENAKM